MKPLTPEEVEKHRENERVRSKKYREENREKINAKAREFAKTEKGKEQRRRREATYRAKNRDKFKAKNKKYWEKISPERRAEILAGIKATYNNLSPEEKKARRERKSAKIAERLRTEPAFRMLFAARKNLNLGLAGVKKKKSQSANSYQRYFGCSAGELKSHIESQFSPEMTWENHGSVWHVDHIVPLSLGRGNQDLLMKLSHFRNLRPLNKDENMRKKDSLPEVWPEGVPFTREELGLAPVLA